MKIIEAARSWEPDAYEAAAQGYLEEIQEEIEETQSVIRFAPAYITGTTRNK